MIREERYLFLPTIIINNHDTMKAMNEILNERK